ncbi:MAG: hypothetical protein ACJ8KA_16500 [Sulfurifustis sp.]
MAKQIQLGLGYYPAPPRADGGAEAASAAARALALQIEEKIVTRLPHTRPPFANLSLPAHAPRDPLPPT